MIRNVAIHVANEQPLLADLYSIPSSADAGLLCTNVRTPDGKRPVFIDDSGSSFFFPYRVIRFLEIPAGQLARHQEETGGGTGLSMRTMRDEDRGTPLPVVLTEPGLLADEPGLVTADGDAGGEAADLEIDEAFLQRVRDI